MHNVSLFGFGARARVSIRVGFDDAGDEGSDATFSMGLSCVIGLYASCGRIARARVEPGDAVPYRTVPYRTVPSRPVPRLFTISG